MSKHIIDLSNMPVFFEEIPEELPEPTVLSEQEIAHSFDSLRKVRKTENIENRTQSFLDQHLDW